MTYKVITTVLHLISIIHSTSSVEYQESELISKLNIFFNFDHNIFLFDTATDFKRFISKNNNIPQRLYIFESGNDNITGLESLADVKSKNTFVVAVPDSVKFERNLKLQTQLKKIRQVQINIKIGLFFANTVSAGDLHNIFAWCWDARIINIFVATYLHSEVNEGSNRERVLNIFTFNPFGKFSVINVTGQSYDNFFLKQNSNFQQHTLRLGQLFNRLSDEILWLALFRFINASFVFEEGTVDTVDIVPTLHYSKNITGYMYPILMESEIIAVPEALPYAEFYAYLQTMTSDNFIGYSLITIAAVTLLLILCRYIKQKKILIFQSIVDVVNLLMNDNEDIKYQELSSIEVFIIVPLTFVGLIIVNGILSNLQSHLTRPVIQPQINTAEDIYRSPFPIFTLNEVWKQRLADALQNQSEHRNWNDRIYLMHADLLEKEIVTYNTSISFLWNLPAVQSALRVQKQLDIKGYHIALVHVWTNHLTYRLNDMFPFKERFNEIIFRMKSAGLFEKWLRDEFSSDDAVIFRKNSHVRHRQENDVGQFPFPMLIVYGWLISVIVFFVEIIWKRYKFAWILSIYKENFR